MNQRAASEAIFGSCSRGDADAFSDRDILIVDDDYATLTRRQAELEADGWSVASYTFRKLVALAEKGALFLQHLKLESEITEDRNGRLRVFLESFTPKLSYSVELDENAQLAALASLRPNTASGALWASDVLYVCMRNAGILQLASRNCHLYSYPDVLDKLTEFGLLSRDAVSPLLKLRLAKSLYRSSAKVPEIHATGMLNLAVRHLPSYLTEMPFHAISPRDLIASTRTLPKGVPSYYRLRSLERTYVSLLSLVPAAAEIPELATLQNWIRNPRAYAGYASRNELGLNELLIRVCSDCAAEPSPDGLPIRRRVQSQK